MRLRIVSGGSDKEKPSEEPTVASGEPPAPTGDTPLQFDVQDPPALPESNVMRLLPNDRPPKREHCENGVRPCPYVSCRYNLYLDVRGDGVLRVNFPNLEPDEMIASCALDMAEDGPRTLDQVASLMGMSKERARQIEASALAKLRVALGVHEIWALEDFGEDDL